MIGEMTDKNWQQVELRFLRDYALSAAKSMRERYRLSQCRGLNLNNIFEFRFRSRVPEKGIKIMLCKDTCQHVEAKEGMTLEDFLSKVLDNEEQFFIHVQREE